jgi:hypothetical protein
MGEAAVTFGSIALRQRQSRSFAGEEPATTHLLRGLAGIFVVFD